MKFIDLEAQQKQLHPSGRTLKEEINNRILKVINKSQFISGPEVDELEEVLKNFIKCKYCISTSSGTDALLIALMSLDIKSGDEIITTPFSFISTAEVISLLGAIPVFVDIDPRTYNIDPKLVNEAITPKTKAIIAVSLYGQPADFSHLNSIGNKNNIPIIEDGAQSFGSKHKDQFSCNLSTIGTTSFFPSKPFGAYGDGGACFTNDEILADRMRRISKHGQTKRYFHSEIGINGRLDTIQAAILLAKFPLFEEEIKLRQKNAEFYTLNLNNNGILTTPFISKNNTSVFAQYTIQVDERSFIENYLKDNNIPTSVHYPLPLNDQPAFKNKYIKKDHIYKSNISREVSQKVLSIPMHPWITQIEQEKVIENLSKAIHQCVH